MKDTLAVDGGPPAVAMAKPRPWPWVPESHVQDVTDAIDQGHLYDFGRGPHVAALEELIRARHAGRSHVLLTSSGTAALHSAYFALGIREGDEVIVPAYTFHATATPLFLLGATPVLADCEPRTATLDPEQIPPLVSARTRAIVVTHLWGHPCRMPEIMAEAARVGIPVIEDASHAHGAHISGRSVGTFGEIAVYSMGGAKPVSGGMGGAIVTDDRDLYERALLLGHGYERAEEEVRGAEFAGLGKTGLGANYRMSTVATVIARGHWETLDSRVAVRTRNLHRLGELLEASGLLSAPRTESGCSRGGWYGYKAFASHAHDEDLGAILRALQAEGVPVGRPGTKPLHQERLFMAKDRSWLRNFRTTVRQPAGGLPVSEAMYTSAVGFSDRYLWETAAEDYIEAIGRAVEKVAKHFQSETM